VGRIADVVTTFELMDDYGCIRDVVSLNSLLSVVCGSGRVIEACNYLQIAKKFVRPSYDTYAILMEGLESGGNVVRAKEIFYDMIFEISWDPANISAYNFFLCTLTKGSNGIHKSLKFFDLLRDRGCYPDIRFFGIVLDECVRFNDIRRAAFFWEIMLGKAKLQPTTAMCNLMIAMYYFHSDIDAAMNILDDMVCKEAFPNQLTYNLLFWFLINGKKLWKTSEIFTETVLNGCVPNQLNCEAAVRVYLDNGDPVISNNVW
jgi:pentatricopeptide repeat protein